MSRHGGFRLVVIGLFLSTLPLFGALFRSNSLGQLLEAIEVSQRNDFSYVVESNELPGNGEARVLYNNGAMVGKVEIEADTKNPTTRTVTEYSFDDDGALASKVQTRYEHGLPQSIAWMEGEVVHLTLHSYVDGKMVETKDLVDGELVNLITYYRGSDGMLSGLRIVGLDGTAMQTIYSQDRGVSVYGENIQGAFTKLSFYPGNLVVRDVWTNEKQDVETTVAYDDAGRLVIDETIGTQRRQKTYGPDGMLVKSESEDADGKKTTISYVYDHNGVLDQSMELQVGEHTRRIERWYKNGMLETQTEWLDDSPVKATRYLADGTSVVTLFDKGRPYADVTYAPDGKRVLSLEYRKER